MPMYEYKCATCATRFEKLLPHSQADKVQCETCHAPAERVISRFGTGGGTSGHAAPVAAAPARKAGGGHACGRGCSH